MTFFLHVNAIGFLNDHDHFFFFQLTETLFKLITEQLNYENRDVSLYPIQPLSTFRCAQETYLCRRNIKRVLISE